MAPDERPRFPIAELLPSVTAVAEEVVRTIDSRVVPVRDLVHRTLLHLPRFAPADLTHERIGDEADRLVKGALRARDAVQDRIPGTTEDGPSRLECREVSSVDADTLHRSFHYIGTSRAMVAAFGLFRRNPLHEELPLAALTLDGEVGLFFGESHVALQDALRAVEHLACLEAFGEL